MDSHKRGTLELPETAIRTLRIIIAALALTLFGAALVMTCIRATAPLATDPRLTRVLLLVLVLLIAADLPVVLVVRMAIVNRLRREFRQAENSLTTEQPRGLIAGFFSIRLIPAAMLVGFGLLGAITYLLTGALLALLAPALALLGLVLLFPSRDAFGRFAAQITAGSM